MKAIYDEFKENLVKAGVDKECTSLQVDFEKLFLKGLETREANPYAEYLWVVKPHSVVKDGNVIHAVPPIQMANNLPWEEWFLWEGKPRHHVLYTARHNDTDIEFFGPVGDQDHPEQVLGIQWFYFHDPELTPVLLR